MPLRILLPLTIVTFAVGTDTFVIAGLLPAISQELHVSPTSAGQLVTAFSITFALAAPILGAITGGLRRDTALKLGLIGFIIGNAATALAPTFGLALAARILTALGASLLTPSASTITVALAPADKRGRALAIVMGGLMSATALGVSLGLIIGQTNWRHTMWALTVLGVASLIAVFRWIPPVTLPAIPLRNRLQPLKDLRVLGIVATTILVVGSNMQIYVYTGLITGATGTMLIIGLTTFGVCTIIGNFAAGKLTDAYTPQLAVLGSIIGPNRRRKPSQRAPAHRTAVLRGLYGLRPGWCCGKNRRRRRGGGHHPLDLSPHAAHPAPAYLHHQNPGGAGSNRGAGGLKKFSALIFKKIDFRKNDKLYP